ncbi:P10.1 [Mycoplasma phage P1]|uniref:P10.1 n=1 Tax=Mycoplasma phage P1 TaxID=2905920 RepID=Q9FZQ8_9CAUD|nr:P10.1 [Mycoplasma phage P1]AAG01286.1 P10.1 [Mycoplasma phage P1]
MLKKFLSRNKNTPTPKNVLSLEQENKALKKQIALLKAQMEDIEKNFLSWYQEETNKEIISNEEENKETPLSELITNSLKDKHGRTN